MNSNNVIQFPGQDKENKTDTSTSLSAAALANKNQSVIRQMIENKNFVAVLIIGFSLFTFNLNFNSNQNSVHMSSLSQGRGVASLQSSSVDNTSNQLEFAKRFASIDLKTPLNQSVGRGPSSDDQVRHGVLASKGYIFKRNLKDGNLVSIQLQVDETTPAYLLDPQDFLEEYGDWLNSDFMDVELAENGEQIIGDRRLSHYILETRSGRRFRVVIERDLFQRLTSLSQTEVAENTFN